MNDRRFFNTRERAALYRAAGGHCEKCGTDLEPGWHADHAKPYSAGGPTHVTNGQALCPGCNLRKGTQMARPLRQWQEETHEQYRRAVMPPRFHISAFPGMGKTEGAAAILEHTGRFGIVLVPQADTLTSWRKTLHGRAICPTVVASDGSYRTVCGDDVCAGKRTSAAVMTYAFAMINPDIIVSLYKKYRECLLILDEVHHLRSKSSWANPIKIAQPYVDAVLTLSGTPFRTDEEPVPFVHTEGPWAQNLSALPDHCMADYGYGKALTMKPPPVNRAVFERYDGDVTWMEGGEERTAKLSTKSDKETARKARKHVVDPRGDWLQRVIRDADRQLTDVRSTDRKAGGLVICKSTDHAVAVADLLTKETSGSVAVYTEDYETLDHRRGNGRKQDASGKRQGHKPRGIGESNLQDFEQSGERWIVTVRKISEGVDVPRLRVLVYATVTRTLLFFVQAFGRVIRVVPDLPKSVDQTAWVYIPDDELMRGFAEEIEDGIADAEIKMMEDEEDEEERARPDLLFDVPGEHPESFDSFIHAAGEYTGATAKRVSVDAYLAELARGMKGSYYENLENVHRLWQAGVIVIPDDDQGAEGAQLASDKPDAEAPYCDPIAKVEEQKKKKNEAATSWAAQRLKAGEFKSFGEAASACNTELGNRFGVWKGNANVAVGDLQKATQYAREQIKELRRGRP